MEYILGIASIIPESGTSTSYKYQDHGTLTIDADTVKGKSDQFIVEICKSFFAGTDHCQFVYSGKALDLVVYAISNDRLVVGVVTVEIING